MWGVRCEVWDVRCEVWGMRCEVSPGQSLTDLSKWFIRDRKYLSISPPQPHQGARAKTWIGDWSWNKNWPAGREMETTAHSTFSVYFLSPDTETNTLSLSLSLGCVSWCKHIKCDVVPPCLGNMQKHNKDEMLDNNKLLDLSRANMIIQEIRR